MTRKRCPNCNSRKWKENQLERGKWKCFSCGFEWKDPRYHRTIFTKELHIGHGKPQKTMRSDEQFLKDNPQLLSVDLHDNVYKFEIKKDNPDVKIGEQVRNWPSRKEVLHKENITYQRTTKHVQISIEKRFIEQIKNSLSEIDQKDFNIQQFFINKAKQFQEEFNIVLNLNLIPVNKEVKTIEAFRSPVQFYSDKVKCVYPNGDIEMIGIDAIKSWKNFVNNLAIETKADDLMKGLDGGFNTLSFLLTQQNEIILKVLNKPSFFSRVFNFFKKFKELNKNVSK